jgi:hypothetical protein
MTAFTENTELYTGFLISYQLQETAVPRAQASVNSDRAHTFSDTDLCSGEVRIILRMRGLRNDAVNSSDYVTSNGRMISEQ